jgi:DNA repair protein SbcD/Mre11
MALKILHTADWHIGQTFHNFDRQDEHAAFLNWLLQTIDAMKIDVLLVSGDVFDTSNPSPEAHKLYYKFLSKAIKANPDLQIIITAGNHDSAARLEAPKALLNNFGIRVVGKLKKLPDGHFDYNKVTIPLVNKQGDVTAWCLAIPYLRPADFAHLPENYKNYAKYVAQFYKEAYQFAEQKKTANQAIIAMGHLHTNAADTTDENRTDKRQAVGGTEHIAADAFDESLSYVALGHIHKAQRIGGQEHIRYSGSPLPMSFTEKNYGHQVIVFDLVNNKAENIQTVSIPITAHCIAIPKKHLPINDAILEIMQLPNCTAADDNKTYPYICVNILVDGPDPERRIKIENALEGKQARFVKMDCQEINASTKNRTQYITDEALHQLDPTSVLLDMYAKKYQQTMPSNLLELFTTVLQNLDQQ